MLDVLAARLTTMHAQPPNSFRRVFRLPTKSRRRYLALLSWVTAVLLICFLIAVAAGLINAKVTQQGWGVQADYVGRYNVLDVKERNNGATTRLAGGELTMFLRLVHKGAPLQPSGILNLNSPDGTLLLYLTALTSHGSARHAAIRGGAFVGPVVGSFNGTSNGENRITGTATVKGLGGVIDLVFARFSALPQP